MFRGQVFQYTVLPFGMAQSPWIFTKLMDNLASHMRHPGISVPRQLAYKRSNLQPTNISHKILPPNCTKSRFHSKSKEVKVDTSPEIHVYRDGISDTTEYSQSQFPTSDYQTVSFPDASFSTNFLFSFGQTQCSSRLRIPRQTTLTSASNVSSICLETSHSANQSLHSDISSYHNRFLINVQVQGQHPHQWAPFQIACLLYTWQISHQISRYIYHEG